MRVSDSDARPGRSGELLALVVVSVPVEVNERQQSGIALAIAGACSRVVARTRQRASVMRRLGRLFCELLALVVVSRPASGNEGQ